MNSIWFHSLRSEWKIGFTSYLGSNTAGIIGSKAEDDWPENLSGWKYGVGTNWIDAGSDIVVEDYCKGKYENQFQLNSFEIHSILISF